MEVDSIKNKMFFIAVPLIIVIFLLLVSCDTSVNNTYKTVSPNKAIDDLQSDGFTFTKSSLTLGDIFDYQKYDLSSVLPQSKTLDGFGYVDVEDINAAVIYYWLSDESGNNQLYSYNYADGSATPKLLFEFGWDKIYMSNTKICDNVAWVWLQDKEGKSAIYKADSHENKPIFEAYSSWEIIFAVSKDYMFVSLREGTAAGDGKRSSGEFILQAIRLQDGAIDTIAKTNYSLDEKGLFSGQVMIPGGMSKDGKGLYYQVVTLDNENINYQGDTTLKYYSCANKVSTEIMDMERKIDYAYGTEEYLLVSEHVYDKPAKEIVKIYKMEDGQPKGYFAVPEFDNTGGGGIEKVVNAETDNSEYLIFRGAPYCLYVYDLTDKTYVAHTYAENFAESQKFSAHVGEDAIRIIEYNDDRLPSILHIYHIK